MPKLQRLKPRLATLNTRQAATLTAGADRLRGRAAVKRRADFLDRRPLCKRCEERGLVTAAVTPDHVLALTNGGTDTEDNLQSLCAECHRLKTEKDLGYRHKPQIGPDGWPIG